MVVVGDDVVIFVLLLVNFHPWAGSTLGGGERLFWRLVDLLFF